MSEESKGTAKSSRRWGRRWRGGVWFLVLLSVASLGVYLWSERVVIADAQIRQALEQVGLDAFDLEVSDVGLSGARVQSFQIGDPEQPTLIVQDIRVGYSILGLWAREIRSVEIGALSLNLSADERGLILDPLAPLLRGGGGGSGVATGPVSIAAVDVSLQLPQAIGHVRGGVVVVQ